MPNFSAARFYYCSQTWLSQFGMAVFGEQNSLIGTCWPACTSDRRGRNWLTNRRAPDHSRGGHACASRRPLDLHAVERRRIAVVLAVRLAIAGRVVRFLAIARPGQTPWDRDDLDFVRATAERVWSSLGPPSPDRIGVAGVRQQRFPGRV